MPLIVGFCRGQEAAVPLQGPRCGAAEEGGGSAAPARRRHPGLRGPRCTAGSDTGQGLSGKREPIGKQREREGGIVHQSAGGKGKASQSNSALGLAQVSLSVPLLRSPQRRFVPSIPVPSYLVSFRGFHLSEGSVSAAPPPPNTRRATEVAGPPGVSRGREEQGAGARAAAILWV